MNRLFVFSGTGNSLAAAQEIQRSLPDFEIQRITTQTEPFIPEQTESVGLVFPVYAWGMPHAVVNWIKKLKLNSHPYLFALATCGGGGAGTLLQCRKLIALQGGKLSLGAFVTLPSNYILWGDAPKPEVQQKMFERASEKIQSLIPLIEKKQSRPMEKGSVPANFFLSKILYPLAVKHFKDTGKKFQIQENCTGCGICEKICPSGNIRLENQKPRFSLNCEQCLACLQWCPENAISYAGKTKDRRRYHHPEIKVSDLFKDKSPRPNPDFNG